MASECLEVLVWENYNAGGKWIQHETPRIYIRGVEPRGLFQKQEEKPFCLSPKKKRASHYEKSKAMVAARRAGTVAFFAQVLLESSTDQLILGIGQHWSPGGSGRWTANQITIARLRRRRLEAGEAGRECPFYS